MSNHVFVDDEEFNILGHVMRQIVATIFSCIVVALMSILIIDIVLHWSQGDPGILGMLDWRTLTYVLFALSLSGLTYVMLDVHQLRQRLARQSMQLAAASAEFGASGDDNNDDGNNPDSVDNFLRKLRDLFDLARMNADLVSQLNGAGGAAQQPVAAAGTAPGGLGYFGFPQAQQH